MFRGAIILGIGFSLGYAKAIQDSQEIKGLLVELVADLKTLSKEINKKYNDTTEGE